jgi:WD40 repeat protein
MSAFGSTASSPGSNPVNNNNNSNRPSSIAPNDCNVPSPGNDGISSLHFSPTSNALVSTNWDAGVRIWDVQFDQPTGQIRANPQAQGKKKYNYQLFCI